MAEKTRIDSGWYVYTFVIPKSHRLGRSTYTREAYKNGKLIDSWDLGAVPRCTTITIHRTDNVDMFLIFQSDKQDELQGF